MWAQVLLPSSCIRLEPGGYARCVVRVRNLGLTADRFAFEVVGAAASWTTLDPPVLELGPEATSQVVAHFRPPRAAHVRAGSMPFGVLTTSAREAVGSVVEQLLEVGRFTDTIVDLVPRVIRRRSATFALTVNNRGNDTVRLRVRGRDLAGALRVECAPESLTVFPGALAHSGIRVRPTHWRWSGAALTRPFQVIVQAGQDTPLVVAGELVHHAILSYASGPV
ncbi:MAG TPA: hypothetical protein VGJ13_09105 [Pseudonocardiaceae bacterium]|jgi:hypothetical protein